MKSKLLLMFILLFFVLVPFVSAQTPISTSKGTQKREETRIKIENKREEVNLKISAIRRERISSYFNRMKIRLEATIERIQKLINRLNIRIEKINALDNKNKIDTTKPKEELDLASLKLSDIKTRLASLTIDDVLLSDKPREDFKVVIDSIKLIKDDLKEVHKILVQTIGDLKGLRVGDTNNEK